MNFYVLYKIFKDIATNCRLQIVRILEESMFRHIETQVLDEFAHYIIAKHEVLTMQYHDDEDGHDHKQEVSIMQRILQSNKVKWREAIREDGEIGILVELEGEDTEGTLEDTEGTLEDEEKRNKNQAAYMLRVNDEGELSVMHSSSITQKWQVCKKAEQKYALPYSALTSSSSSRTRRPWLRGCATRP